MQNMHNFSRTLAEYFAGNPELQQNEFADKARIQRSKVCRLLQNKISCDRESLDHILGAVPDPKARQKLVKAFIEDMCSPGALLHLKSNPHGLWDGFDFSPLSPKGAAALKKILTGPGARSFEKIIIAMSEALP
ncbi:MAG TPA: hypothetical protein VMU04_24735 [Candidatus Acidoferrum sp.]|nr:hypothetical protein [Candidatus Acidoferrum sp.]